MEYIYHCQIHAQERIEKIASIPKNTIISKDYLYGLDNDEFVRAFSSLQDITRNIYNDMKQSPEAYGLKLTPAYTDGSVNLVSCFGDILYNIGLYGELINNKLLIKIDDFKKTIQKHKFNLTLYKLIQFGFVIEGFNGKSFNKGITEFTLGYPINSNIITVIKSFATASKTFIDKATTDRYYISDIFNTFSYRPLEDKLSLEYEPMFLMMTDWFNETSKKVIYNFHKKLKDIGMKYSSLYGSISYQKSSTRIVSLWHNREKGNIQGRLMLNDVNKILDNIIELNDSLKKPFLYSTCHFCGGQTNANNPCPKRVVHKIDGITYYNCKMVSFIFNDIKHNDVDELVNILKKHYITK